MRGSAAILLALVFAWNSVPGGMGVFVLCLHPDGDTHSEMRGGGAPGASSDCAGGNASACLSDCPACIDVVLPSADLRPTRPSDPVATSVPVLLAGNAWLPFPGVVSRPGIRFADSRLERFPPGAEPTAQLISRTIVLRL